MECEKYGKMNTNTDIIDQLIGHFLGHLHSPVPRVPQGPLLHWKTLGSHGFGAVVIGLKAKERFRDGGCTMAGSLVILCAVIPF